MSNKKFILFSLVYFFLLINKSARPVRADRVFSMIEMALEEQRPFKQILDIRVRRIRGFFAESINRSLYPHQVAAFQRSQLLFAQAETCLGQALDRLCGLRCCTHQVAASRCAAQVLTEAHPEVLSFDDTLVAISSDPFAEVHAKMYQQKMLFFQAYALNELLTRFVINKSPAG